MRSDEKKDDYRRKYEEALKEIERLKKENKDLKKKLAFLEQEKELKTPSPFYRPCTKGAP